MSERSYQAERIAQRKHAEEELESVKRFHAFLQGIIPKGCKVRKIKKMNPKQAFTVIWFLQEVCHLIDDRFEMCDSCESMYDSYYGGRYDEKTGHTYCDSCDTSGY